MFIVRAIKSVYKQTNVDSYNISVLEGIGKKLVGSSTIYGRVAAREKNCFSKVLCLLRKHF